MKEYLATLIQSSLSPVEARNLAREYLQALILQSLQRAGAMTALAFYGGTALRFLFSLPRYSEDLDFALQKPDASFSLRPYLEGLAKELTAYGYGLDITYDESLGEEVIGHRVRATVKKNKVAPPFREAEFDILHNEGISKTGAVIDAAVNTEVATKSGTWLSFGNEKLGQGREAAIKTLRENPKLQEEIEKEVRKKISLG
jgi:hypothetical protein